ncbi:MAG: hypothetical protein OEV06_03920 [Anaerolineae bacterium]|nr:hypothetical protein [Anaerolineae bacterium]
MYPLDLNHLYARIREFSFCAESSTRRDAVIDLQIFDESTLACVPV